MTMPRRQRTTNSSRNVSDADDSMKTSYKKFTKIVVWWLRYRRLRDRLVAALLLTAIFRVLVTPDKRMDEVDVVVVCLSYGLWFAVCLPKLLVYLNPAFMSRTIVLAVKVFYIEILVICYASLRGHESLVLRPATSREHSPCQSGNVTWEGLAWLGQVGYNLRMATLASCGAIATISHVLDYLQTMM